MSNPFEVIDLRLSNIESLLLDIKHRPKNEEPADTPGDVLTIKSAAEYLHLKVPTLYSMISRGDIPVMKKNGRCYFSKAELMEYLKSGRRKTNSELEKEASTFLQMKNAGRHGR